MQEYGFSLTRVFPYQNRTFDSAFQRENAGQIKPVLWHILRRDRFYILFLYSFYFHQFELFNLIRFPRNK